ncbi:MAG: flippase-like domain-containing protein [Phycisphaerae bacterium]|nr:flippase-like domain-containing protein [Phycisphaerae bacterium]
MADPQATTTPPPEPPPARSQSQSLRRRLSILLRGIVSLALLAILVVKVGDDALLGALRTAIGRWWLLVPALLLPPVAGYTISLLRLRGLLRAQGVRIRDSEILRAALVGTFFNQLLPTSVGGDVYRVWYLGRLAGELTPVFSSVLLGRTLGVTAMCLLVIGGSVARPSWFQQVPALRLCIPLLAGTVVVAVLALALVRPPAVRPARKGLGLYRKWYRVSTALSHFRAQPLVVLQALAYSLALQLNIVAMYWVLARSLDVSVPFDRFLVAVPLVTLATMVPFSFNGIGVREWVMIWICRPIGIQDADAALVALLFLSANLMGALVGGILWQRMPSPPPEDTATTPIAPK